MSASWNFAKRPFRDDRPIYAATALLFLVGAVLLLVNVRLYSSYRRGVADVRAEIATLEGRQRAAEAKASAAKNALSSYKVSALADESRELARVVAERRFSWTGLLARLEHTLPSEVGLQRLQPQFDKDGITLDLQLVGRNREAVVPTLAALAKDPEFSGVQLHMESQPEGNTAEPFQFTVTSGYRPEAKVETAAHRKTGEKGSVAAKPAPRPAAPKPAPAPKPVTAPGSAAPRSGAPKSAAPKAPAPKRPEVRR
ncbi:MAG TPA: hypothetical protein VMH79_07260 [Thermoanaerobaculia bacterium]|nr:hypothetical protein [Thermoanaerobaculia bacterium]